MRTNGRLRRELYFDSRSVDETMNKGGNVGSDRADFLQASSALSIGVEWLDRLERGRDGTVVRVARDSVIIERDDLSVESVAFAMPLHLSRTKSILRRAT